MRENHISPSEALKVGALKLLGEPFQPEKGVVIEKETVINKLARMQTTMQGAINRIQNEKEELEARYNVLVQEKANRESKND